MKKFAVVVFVIALAAGLLLANVFSFGRVSQKLFNFNFSSKVRGSGNVVTERRDISGFRGIDVGGIFKVEAVSQKDFGVEIEVDDNLVPLVRTEVRGGVLHIEFDGHLKSRGPILVRVFAPDFESIDASGASSVTVAGLKNSLLSIDSSGASKITVSGETKKLSIDVSGATRINAGDLKAADVNVEASGASHVDVFATETLTADASGATKVSYSGSPKNVNRKSSGASSITGN